MTEQWATLKDCTNYEVSNNGRVRNLKTQRELKPYPNADGRLQVKLTSSVGVLVSYYVHRLVAAHFMPGYDELKQIKHFDTSFDNNHISNLEQTDRDAAPRRSFV